MRRKDSLKAWALKVEACTSRPPVCSTAVCISASPTCTISLPRLPSICHTVQHLTLVAYTDLLGTWVFLKWGHTTWTLLVRPTNWQKLVKGWLSLLAWCACDCRGFCTCRMKRRIYILSKLIRLYRCARVNRKPWSQTLFKCLCILNSQRGPCKCDPFGQRRIA